MKRTICNRPVEARPIPPNEASRAYLRQGALGAPSARAERVMLWTMLICVAGVLCVMLGAI